MARRKAGQGDLISLFPFLSILACVIGTLTMIITALALAQAGQPERAETEAAAAAAEKRLADFKAQQVEIAAAQTRLDALLKDVARAEAERKSFLAKRAETDRRRLELERLRKESTEREAEIARLRRRLADLQQGLAALDTAIRDLQAELKKRQEVPKEAVVQLQGRGSGRNLSPVFVECVPGGVVLHGGAAPARLPLAGLAENAAFVKAMDAVKAKASGTMIFLLRPDGLGSYQTVRRMADANGVRNGKLPVPGQGRLDLGPYAQEGG